MTYDPNYLQPMTCDVDSGELETIWMSEPISQRGAPVVPPRLGIQSKPPKWFLEYMEKVSWFTSYLCK